MPLVLHGKDSSVPGFPGQIAMVIVGLKYYTVHGLMAAHKG